MIWGLGFYVLMVSYEIYCGIKVAQVVKVGFTKMP